MMRVRGDQTQIFRIGFTVRVFIGMQNLSMVLIFSDGVMIEHLINRWQLGPLRFVSMAQRFYREHESEIAFVT